MNSPGCDLPTKLQPEALGQLSLEVQEFADNYPPAEYYACEIELPPHGRVTVIVYPPKRGIVNTLALSGYVDSHFRKLVRHECEILPSAVEKVRTLYLEYWPERTDVPVEGLV